MESVYAVISVLNGYQKLEDIFRNKIDAEKYVNGKKADYRYDRHEFYVCEYNLL